jgi:hypothetical protein
MRPLAPGAVMVFGRNKGVNSTARSLAQLMPHYYENTFDFFLSTQLYKDRHILDELKRFDSLPGKTVFEAKAGALRTKSMPAYSTYFQ